MKLNPTDSESSLHSNMSYNSDVDWYKLGIVARKSLPWIIFIFMLCIGVSYLVIRYTKPLYESYSEIKLDQEDKSNVLNLPDVENNNTYALMSSEMELITSRLFFNKIIESLRLNPQYFSYGQFLEDEKYANPPFTVKYELKNAAFYNKKIDVTIIDSTRFILGYHYNDRDFEKEYLFGSTIENENYKFNVTISPIWNPSMGYKFGFIINSHDALIKYLENNLSVEPVNLDANIFRISLKDYSLSKAHALISAIDTLYYTYSLAEKNLANKNKIEYLNNQLVETEKKLDDYEKYFEDVTITNRTVSLNEDVKRTVDLINGLDSQRVNLNERLAFLNDLSNEVKTGRLITIPSSEEYLPTHIISLVNELNLLINEREKLGLSYKKNTYTYRSRQKEIDLLKADLLAEIEDSKKRVIDDIRNLKNQKSSLNQQLNKLPSKNTEYNKIKRFYSLYEEVYLSLMQSKNEFEIAIAGSTTKIKILSPATMPNTPIKPNPVIIYGVGGAFFLLISIAFIVISYLSHDKINNLVEVERSTTATLLGAVPHYKSKDKHAKVIVSKHSKSILSESLRSIRTNMEFMLPDIKSKVYSFTSTIGSEGKTFISTNLAALLTMAGKKVIVIDLDLRRPKVHKAFNQAADKCGMSTLLIKKNSLDECLKHSDLEGLDYIGAGPVPPNPSELILRDSFDEILNELKQRYDIIILDTPPVGIVTDGLLAMQKADLPIYILRADYSKLSFIKNINRLVATKRYPNFSIILNNVSSSKSGYGYSYGDVYSSSSYYQE